MSFFKKIFVVLAIMGAMIPSFAFADDFGLGDAAGGTGLIQVQDTQTDIPNLIGKIVGVALSFVGAIFFLLILYAGFLWMTAFGSSEKVDKSKEILIHAVIGLIIVLAAYAISKFVFGALTGGVTSANSSGGSSANAATCPIGSVQGQTTCGAGNRSTCDCGKITNETCDVVGACIQKCDYLNSHPAPSIGSNFACTNVSATGGNCPAGKTQKLNWCASNDSNTVCCYDGP